MSLIPIPFRTNRGKSDLLYLFAAAVGGQALALIVGLWLEQKLVDSSAAWLASEHLESSEQSFIEINRPPVRTHLDVASGADIFMIKMIVFLWTCFSQTVIAYLILARWNATRMRQQSADADAYARQNHDLIRTRDAVIFGLAKLAESRDPETGHHLERIAIYASRLASAMRQHPRFASIITPNFLRILEVSSALHDIGKVGVEDAILLKPGRLTESERRKIERHTTLGGDCIEQIESRLGSSNFLEMAREIALCHHERWDGSGYPAKLSGTQIPLAARIISVADVYDALSVRRVYKKAFPHEKCVRIIREGAGSQFDPDIVDVFLQIEVEFRQCAEEMSDHFDLGDTAEVAETPAMTQEQEQFLARLIVSEKYCSVDALMVPAGAGNDLEFDGSNQISTN